MSGLAEPPGCAVMQEEAELHLAQLLCAAVLSCGGSQGLGPAWLYHMVPLVCRFSLLSSGPAVMCVWFCWRWGWLGVLTHFSRLGE